MLVDPKQVELNHYESIPHLLTPVITSPRMAANALQNLVKEMEQRYGTMSLARTRSLPELNRAREKRGEPPLPYILCVIDELADLMMVAPADVEDSIIRLAQKARAVGIHLVLATQSPRVDVITGMIKANVPSRIAFAVSSQTDSRVILDHNGAESLLGQGDMLFSPVGSSKLQRIQGAYIDEEQIARADRGLAAAGRARVPRGAAGGGRVRRTIGSGGDDAEFSPDEDPLLEEAIALVAQMGTASTSMLQRRLRLGYTRAGRLIDMLERRGIISGYEGSKPRQVLITEADVPRILSHLAEAEGGGGPPAAPVPDPPAGPSTPTPSRPASREAERSELAGRRSDASLRRLMADIGTTLREARMRARIDINEVEARTKIRAKYLRAIENEEWDLLPGPGLRQELPADLRRLPRARQPPCSIDEYKRRYERPSDHELRPITLAQPRARARPPRGPLIPPWADHRRGAGRRSSSPCTSSGSHQGQERADHDAQRPPATTTARHDAPQAQAPQARTRPPPKPTTVTLKLVPTGPGVRVPGRRQRQEADPGADLRRRADDPDRDARRSCC